MLATLTMATPRARANQKEIPAWADALRVRRVQLGLSQEELAARSDEALSQRTVSALETGGTPLENMSIGRVVALARALNWTLAEMQRATGVDLGMVDATLIGEGSADVYPLASALTPDAPGVAVEHELVAPGLKRPMLFRTDTDEMHGTSPASIRPGSTLHVDLADSKPKEGHVYVVTDQDGAHVRLYAVTRLGAVFRADNRAHEDIPASDARVVGRVVSVASDYDPAMN